MASPSYLFDYFFIKHSIMFPESTQPPHVDVRSFDRVIEVLKVIIKILVQEST